MTSPIQMSWLQSVSGLFCVCVNYWLLLIIELLLKNSLFLVHQIEFVGDFFGWSLG